VKKVKKTAVKILVPILAFLMLLSMASCVKACVCPQPTKTAITAILGTSSADTNVKYVVNGQTEYLLYYKFSGTLLIYAGSYTYFDLPSTPMTTVNFVNICWGTYNIATNTGSYMFYEVWTLPSGATFVGSDHPVLSTGDLISAFSGYPALTALSSHIVVAGRGGQVVDVATSNAYANPWTGYWVTT
jgi:hypothetical protein